MNGLVQLLHSSIGAKHIMAISGIALLGFVIAHMLGNLQIFLGQEAVNAYAQGLKDTGALLWIMRIGLLVVAIAHIATALRLDRDNRRARPIRYAYQSTVMATYASRHMVRSGVVILLFLIYHLLHLTFGVILPDASTGIDAQGRHDVFSMTVRGFQNWIVSGTYILAMLVLGLHLSHAVTSLFQTLGLNHPRYNPTIKWAGPITATFIVVGNISMPLAVLAGIITLPARGA